MIKWSMHGKGDDWAVRFDDAAREIMTTRPADVLELTRHPDYLLAVPTPDHFVPLLHLAGLAAAAGTTADVLVDGCDLGSLSMTSYRVD
jgi:4,5-DOPA dioxygenase extradiol